MLFKNVNSLNNRNEKNYFFELIDLIIDISEELTNNLAIKTRDVNDERLIEEMREYGFINTREDLISLKTILGKNKYEQLLEAIHQSINIYNDDLVKNNPLNKLKNSYRKMLQKKQDNNLSVVDLFCGAGGLSLGFEYEDYKIELANDIDINSIESYKVNHPQVSTSKVIDGDIRELIDNLDEYIKNDIDVVVGGPPCQGFSTANQQRIINDPRNELYKYFIKAVQAIAPKFVVMENVKGMRKVANQVVEDFHDISTKDGHTYIADYEVLNSKFYSVAQSRERLIYIAVRSDLTNEDNNVAQEIFKVLINRDFNLFNLQDDLKIFNLEDALDFIIPLEAEREKNMTNSKSDKTGKKVSYNHFVPTKDSYINIINQGKFQQIIFNHKARYSNDINYEIYKRLSQGEDSTSEKIADIMPYKHRNHLFKDKYYKLIADRPSRTITAHMRMDCHSHIHPYQIRSLTPREAARIQSFPDDFIFTGPYLKTYMQIGNAVPPLMAKTIASEIKKYLLN